MKNFVLLAASILVATFVAVAVISTNDLSHPEELAQITGYLTIPPGFKNQPSAPAATTTQIVIPQQQYAQAAAAPQIVYAQAPVAAAAPQYQYAAAPQYQYVAPAVSPCVGIYCNANNNDFEARSSARGAHRKANSLKRAVRRLRRRERKDIRSLRKRFDKKIKTVEADLKSSFQSRIEGLKRKISRLKDKLAKQDFQKFKQGLK